MLHAQDSVKKLQKETREELTAEGWRGFIFARALFQCVNLQRARW